MGARQSRRSVDITTTPKKEGITSEGGVVSDAAAPGDGKVERIEETDTKPTTNGIAPHTDVAEDKDKDKDDATEKDKDKEKSEGVKPEEKQESAGESPAETAEVTTPTEANPASPNAVTSPENKETKKKDKMKKKWSFRSISFSKKDKSKYAREETPKNGDVTKEEPLAEGGEDAENGSATAGSPVEEKSAVSSPTVENESSPTAAASSPSAETKEESPASAASSPATDDKQEEPTPSAPTPVPVEEKKEEVEKVEAEKKVVEVSPAGGQFVPGPVEVSVFQVQTVATPSIIERKTSEDIPSLPPSSPPPTPIDASPLQQAQQAAATATALAEAFNLPAEAADKDPPPRPLSTFTISSVSSPSCPERNDPSTETAAESLDATSPPQRPPASSADVNPATESGTVLSANAEALPVVDSPLPANESLPDTADAGRTVVDESPVKPPSEIVVKPEPVESPPSPPRTETSNTENTEVIRVSSTEVVDEKIEEVACARVTKSDEANNAPVTENEVSEAVPDVVDKQEPIPVEEETTPESVPEQVEELVKQVIEQPEAIREEATGAFLETEEGVIPVPEEILVEAKPAVVIPEEQDATTVTSEEIDAEKPVNERIEIVVEDKLEPEVEPDIVVPVEEMLVLEEPEDAIVPEEPAQPTTVVIEKQTEIEIIEISDEVTEEMPPPVPESAVPADLPDESDPENANLEPDSKTVPSCLVDDAKSPDLTVESSQEASTVSEQIDIPISTSDVPVSIADESPRTPSTLERVPSPMDEPLPPPTPEQDATQERADSPKYPLPPEELSCPINLSEMKSELPVPDENDAPSPRHPTETLLTPPRSPSPQSIVSIASGLTTSTKDSSQTRLYDDQSNREFKMESVSISLNSYNESDIELKERLAESLVDTVNQEESSVSCQLSNNATSSTTVQETHQSTQETEAPVENSVAHDSTTESSDEISKITTSPAVPSEVMVPASPPSVPVITEDVASVAKAIEEMDISDKAVAAATIECNTNEIIADAHYQNNMNE